VLSVLAPCTFNGNCASIRINTVYISVTTGADGLERTIREVRKFFSSGRAGTGSTGNFFLRGGPVRGVWGIFFFAVRRFGKYGVPRTVLYRPAKTPYRGNTSLRIIPPKNLTRSFL
jgi:hypothetical protein